MPPLLPYFLLYLAGILAALPESNRFLFPYFLPIISGLGGLYLQLRFSFRRPKMASWAVLILLAPLGFLASSTHKDPRPANHLLFHLEEGKPVNAEARLFENPQVLRDRVRYIVEMTRLRSNQEWIPVTGKAQIHQYDSREPGFPKTDLRAGDVIRFTKARLKRPRNFKNPGRFDYRRFLRAKNIEVIGNLSKNGSVERIGAFPLSMLGSLHSSLRLKMGRTIDDWFPGEEGALLKAMLLGDKHSLSEETRENYIATGLAHLMAVSGLHIGFVAAAAYLVLWPLLFFLLYRYAPHWAKSGHTRKICAALCLIPVLFYMILVGPKISSVRAGVMVILALLAIFFGRTSQIPNTLLGAAFLILIWSPHAILDVSFQMTFLAVTGIIFLFLPLLDYPDDPIERMKQPSWVKNHLGMFQGQEALKRNPIRNLGYKALGLFIASFYLSLAVTLFIFPILIAYFNRVSLMGPFLNPFMVPLASIFIPGALLILFLGVLFPWSSFLLKPLLAPFIKFFLIVPEYLTFLPKISIYNPDPSQVWFAGYFLALFTGIYAYKNFSSHENGWAKRKFFQAGYAATLVFLVVGFLWPRFPELGTGKLKINILDVGQGESIFIEFPNRRTLLIDGGGFYKNALDVGKLVVAPFLWNQGIRRIDYLVPTHSDNDHISGLESILDLFPVGHYLGRIPPPRDYRILALREKALEQGAELIPIQPGKAINIGEVRLLPLHPSPAFARQKLARGEPRISNDLSLVLLLEYKKFRMLLTGDIEEKTEETLLAQFDSLQSNFLKAPHHGSRHSNSLEFVKAVRPRQVFFSAGYKNWMRHPHPEIVERYREAGAKIWRTDLDGAITITTDGFTHLIKTHPDL